MSPDPYTYPLINAAGVCQSGKAVDNVIAAMMALTVRSKMMRLLTTQPPFVPAPSQLTFDGQL
jgi:hypothetical protein